MNKTGKKIDGHGVTGGTVTVITTFGAVKDIIHFYILAL